MNSNRKIKLVIFICISFLLITGVCIGLKNDSASEAVMQETAANGVVINEVCHNFSVSMNSIGDNYVEYYNGSEEAVNMEGWYLVDNRIPDVPYYLEPIALEAGQIARKHISNDWEGMDFTLDENMGDADAFTLSLCNAEGEVVDSVSVPQIKYNTSWARAKDGQDSWGNMNISPGLSNTEAEMLPAESLDVPKYSVDSGFYDKEFMLELDSAEKDAAIYYTLDGSVPDENSFKYEEPIRIYDNSDNPNLYASLREICSGYIMDDFVLGYVTEENVPKCMVVRSVVYSNDGTQKSEVETKTYFVDSEGKYKELPIISLVSDPNGLFGYEDGIYVTGATLDEYVESGEELDPAVWSGWESNYTNKGKQWEREAHIDYFNGDRQLVMEQEVGIRIRGGQTRAYPQKSFNVYARSIYERSGFKTTFFGNNTGTRRVTLSSGGNDVDTKIRDSLVHALCADLDFATMQTIPAYVFINGEYWGLYSIVEKYDEYYIEEHYGVKPEDVVMVKVEEPEAGVNPVEEYEIIDDYVDDYDLSDDAVYQEFLNYIDLESFLDYYAAQVYIARCGDWPSSNWIMWKSDEVKEGSAYYDGKWRWMIYDLNWQEGCMSQWLVEHDTIEYLRGQDDFFDALMDNAQFRAAFGERLAYMADVVFENGRVQSEITRQASIVEEPVKYDYQRFYVGVRNPEDFEWGINNMRAFFEHRGDFIRQLIGIHCRQ